ncbi:hypothetical protein C0991_007318 [Blastosporella zonata]|nr:hypothetical protein C0991_007318 [Blastosporella zonata]
MAVPIDSDFKRSKLEEETEVHEEATRNAVNGERKEDDVTVLIYGTEEMEFTITYDTLDKYDLLVIPGGAKGADTMSKNTTVQKLVRDYLNEKKMVGMICAGSLAALTSGLPKQPLTSHPSVKKQLEGVVLE